MLLEQGNMLLFYLEVLIHGKHCDLRRFRKQMQRVYHLKVILAP